MIPKEFYTYFGSHMSSDHGRSHFSPIAKWGSNNFFQNISFIKKNECFSYFYENYVQKEGHYTYILTLESNRVSNWVQWYQICLGFLNFWDPLKKSESSEKSKKNTNFSWWNWHFEKKLLLPHLAKGLKWLLPWSLDMWLPKYGHNSFGIISEASILIQVPVRTSFAEFRNQN